MKAIKILAILGLAFFAANSYAQERAERFSFELNAGPSLAIQSLGDTDLNVGGGFEGIISYRVMPHLGLYTGWGWNKFSSDESFDGFDADFEETGYLFGLQFRHPISSSGMSLVVRLGGLYNHIEIEDPDGEIVYDTKHGLGLQAAAGLDIGIRDKWSITPLVKFHSLSRDLEVNQVTQDLDLKYLSLRVGVVRYF